ncbi:UvrB/UvrC motif-containing protein [Fimbriiglobus ruber]|uniref:Nucleotide excision repair protein, with UvrB/UvrC motif n=1 Tax=Fimbriiglobus ruber TaxID=1908690 RepID=A0A225DF69_9BACT|nr:UvrB/UvrC motif-containing protein [Fimbriiglobus ruber]OWK35986.1 Nucleotide excision repair protein, with UvrB/UvrC motif [Fimbriiglobus ruber]
MKCQRCPKQATLHITEVLTGDQFEELHLCEDCAKKYLYEPTQVAKKPGKAGAGGVVATEPEAGDEPGGKQCEVCGIKFVEFRNTGRLGCPHDYDAFREELLPLLESIHGDTKHQGKIPQRAPRANAAHGELSKLRKKLQQAVQDEAYEEAAKVRDRIRELEGD